MSSPTSPSSPSLPQGGYMNSNKQPAPWQDKLNEQCRVYRVGPPVWQLMSDKRGGRTAWSSTVGIGPELFYARYWYDGKFAHNAKEDAAEVAVQWLQSIAMRTQYVHN